MSITIRYTGTRADKLSKALQDARAWLRSHCKPGAAKLLEAEIAKVHASHGARAAYRSGYFYLEFAGVRGIPARAFIREALRAK